MSKRKQPLEVKCPYCDGDAELVESNVVYKPWHDYGKLWLCRHCWAYTGTHSNSKRHVPKGRLANKELREWKIKAHAAFDPLWNRKISKEGCSKSQARKAGYKWLAEKVGVELKKCHIGIFDVDQCMKVVEICGAYSER